MTVRQIATTDEVAGFESGTEPPARFTDLLAAEWLKLWSVRSIRWFTLAAVALVIGINLNGTRSDVEHWKGMDADQRAYFIRIGAPLSAFDRASASWLMLLFAALGAVTVLNELTNGMFRTAFTAVPARREVIAAKLVVVGAVSAVAGFFVTLVSFYGTQAMLGLERGGISITAPGEPRRFLVDALLAPIMAFAGMALGMLLRHAVAAMTGLFGIVFVIPAFLRDTGYVQACISHLFVNHAWDRLTQIGTLDGTPYPWTRTGAWIVYAIWCLLAIAVTMVLAERRDQ